MQLPNKTPSDVPERDAVSAIARERVGFVEVMFNISRMAGGKLARD